MGGGGGVRWGGVCADGLNSNVTDIRQHTKRTARRGAIIYNVRKQQKTLTQSSFYLINIFLFFVFQTILANPNFQ